VVVWSSCSNQDGSSCGVFGQRFDNAGARWGAEFQVNTYTRFVQNGAAIAMDTSGSFVVVWRSQRDGSDFGVFAQRFDSDGTRAGTEFQVNTFTPQLQGSYPTAIASSPTQFVVVWHSKIQDGSEYGVFAQLFTTNGARLGTEFQVNTVT